MGKEGVGGVQRGWGEDRRGSEWVGKDRRGSELVGKGQEVLGVGEEGTGGVWSG